MRWARLVLLALSALALCAALAPAAASAAPRFSAGFHLHHGRYEVAVESIAQGVFVNVEAGPLESKHRGAGTVYIARGTATESRLQASFGELGSISMRFHPAANHSWMKPSRNCATTARFLERRGTWQGQFHFRGEGGYLRLDVHRVRGGVLTVAPRCRQPGEQRQRRSLIRPSQESQLGAEVPVLQAHWRHGTALAGFLGGGTKFGSYFFASTAESRGQLVVFREAEAQGPPKAVTADRALNRARVAPPAPFHGTARYRAAADGSKTWSGDLTVAFPGAPRYALTGEPFEPKLELVPELVLGAALDSSPAVSLGRPRGQVLDETAAGGL